MKFRFLTPAEIEMMDAAAAFAGYLRDINWQGKKSFQIFQGEDMGCPSRLFVQYTDKKGESIRVSGETRYIT